MVFLWIEAMSSEFDIRKTVLPLYGLAFASLFSSYFREIFIAARIGATLQADVYLSVVTVVRFVCDMGPCAVLLASVVPVLSPMLAQPKAARGHLVVMLLLTALAVTGALAVAMFFAMPWLLTLLAPGFAESAWSGGVALAATLAWYLPLQSVSVLFSLVLNAHGRFLAAGAAPILANAAFVVVLAAAGEQPGANDLGLATVVGPAVTALLLGGRVWWLGLLRPGLSREAVPALRSMWDLARPVILSLGLGSSTGLVMIGHMLLRRHGSLADEGTVATLAYAFRIYQVPVSLTANIAATLVLPSLSLLYGTGSWQRLGDICRSLAEWGVLLLVPMVAVTALEAPLLVDILLVHGRFSSADAARTAEALAGFAPAILFEAAIVVLYRVLYAVRRPKVAAGASLAVIACLAAFTALVPQGDVGGLALAFSGSCAVGVLVVAVDLYRRFGSRVLPFRRRGAAMLGVFALSGAAWLPLRDHRLAAVAAFGVVYLLAALLLMPDHRAALAGLRRRREA
jgi:putative peptidoglycan lipid II flippase